MTAAANKLWLAKVYVADFGDLDATFGLKLAIGDDVSNHYYYNVAGSGANRSVFDTYPAQGGYLIIALDPNVSAWREGTTGSMTDASTVDFFGVQAQFVAGGAKNENLAMDAIDVGTGLQLYGGDGGSTDGSFEDFVAADQGTLANRWGYVVKLGAITIRGMMEIGINNATPTATEFTDDSSTVFFPDGYHSAGLFGCTFDLGHASTIIDLGCTFIGLGQETTEDTRPDFIATGTSGELTFYGTITNHRNVTLTSVCEVTGGVIECKLLTQASADISGCTIKTDAATSVACLQDPTFGATTDLRDVTFEQSGAGHAIELDTATTYNLTDIIFVGYGADASDSAALDVTAASGTVTINILGDVGSTPTYKTAGATVVINNTKTVTITAQDSSGTDIESARVLLEANTGGDLPSGESVSITRSGSTATVSHTAHAIPDGEQVVIRGANQKEYNGIHTITVIGVDSYSYTVSGAPDSPATGTIDATAVILTGTTNASGVLQRTDFNYTNPQPVKGVVRKGTSSPRFKEFPLTGTLDTNGYTYVAILTSDE
jgi:hypothetical protein